MFRAEPAGVSKIASGRSGSADLATLLRGWGQLKASDSGWPVFDGKCVNYPRVQEGVGAIQGDTNHSIVNDDLEAKILREKCVKGDAWKMVDRRSTWRRP